MGAEHENAADSLAASVAGDLVDADDDGRYRPTVPCTKADAPEELARSSREVAAAALFMAAGVLLGCSSTARSALVYGLLLQLNWRCLDLLGIVQPYYSGVKLLENFAKVASL